MHAEISTQLKDFADKRIADVQRALDYDKLKMSVINTEVALGEAERQYNADDEDYEGYLEALEGIWGDVCKAAVTRIDSLADDSLSLANNLNPSPDGMRTALNDNYLYGALAAVLAVKKDKSIKGLPLLAAAAFNKHSYTGYKDEIACLRMLLWAGFDPNAADSNGTTALHSMASMQVNPGSHPRAVRLLLQAGADPNLQNKNGDTALCFMAGNTTWTAEMTDSAWRLLDSGADPLVEASDGASAYSLWKQNQSISEDVAELVSAIEAQMEEIPKPASDGNEGYYEMVGEQIKGFVLDNNPEGLSDFCGYLMAVIVAKNVGQGDQFAKKITPLMLEGFDVGGLFKGLVPLLDEGDSVSVGRAAHSNLSEAARTQYEKLRASMQQ